MAALLRNMTCRVGLRFFFAIAAHCIPTADLTQPMSQLLFERGVPESTDERLAERWLASRKGLTIK